MVIVIVLPLGSSCAIVGVSDSSFPGGERLDGSFAFRRAVVVSDLDPLPLRDLHALSAHGPAAVPADAVGLPLVNVHIQGPSVSAVATPEAAERWRALLGV
jgi:hypothetical protein